MIAALTFSGFFVIFSLTMLFLQHQRQMAELIHGKAANEALQRLQVVEHELRELKAAHHERVLKEEDQPELGRRNPLTGR